MESVDFHLLVQLDALLQTSSVSAAARRMGLSTPAMSHALARIRERLGDAILVRSGRGMLLTPRALLLKPQVHQVVRQARQLLEPEPEFRVADLDRTFVVHASDYVLSLLGHAVDRIVRNEAPHVSIRFVTNRTNDPDHLRDQGSDLAVGIYGDMPQEMRSRQLITDRLVGVLRTGHPALAKRMTSAAFAALPHIQIAPRGTQGGYLDDMLRERGLTRVVKRAVPYFRAGLELAAATDYALTVPERIAQRFADPLGLQIFEVPLKLRAYALSLVWHPRVDGEPGHQFLREAFVLASREVAGDRHSQPRTRLDPTDPTSGQARKRRRRSSQ